MGKQKTTNNCAQQPSSNRPTKTAQCKNNYTRGTRARYRGAASNSATKASPPGRQHSAALAEQSSHHLNKKFGKARTKITQESANRGNPMHCEQWHSLNTQARTAARAVTKPSADAVRKDRVNCNTTVLVTHLKRQCTKWLSLLFHWSDMPVIPRQQKPGGWENQEHSSTAIVPAPERCTPNPAEPLHPTWILLHAPHMQHGCLRTCFLLALSEDICVGLTVISTRLARKELGTSHRGIHCTKAHRTAKHDIRTHTRTHAHAHAHAHTHTHTHSTYTHRQRLSRRSQIRPDYPSLKAYRKAFAAQLKTPASSSKPNRSKGDNPNTRGMRRFAPQATICAYITPRRLTCKRSAPHNARTNR